MNHKAVNNSNIVWDENGLPRSVQFDDKYFCEQNGLTESRYVFCGGNNLKERFKNIPVDKAVEFTLAETGFGSGLNFLCAWELWSRHAPRSAVFHYLSIDRYPLCVEDLSKALKLWPELDPLADQLISQYRNSDERVQDVYFDEKRVKLTLIFDDVVSSLDSCVNEDVFCEPVDAWFLDGFAPAKNPDMWSDEVFERMAALSRKGSTLSTFTVAGPVRRALADKGFAVERVEGFGRKRHMLKGTFKTVPEKAEDV